MYFSIYVTQTIFPYHSCIPLLPQKWGKNDYGRLSRKVNNRTRNDVNNLLYIRARVAGQLGVVLTFVRLDLEKKLS